LNLINNHLQIKMLSALSQLSEFSGDYQDENELTPLSGGTNEQINDQNTAPQSILASKKIITKKKKTNNSKAENNAAANLKAENNAAKLEAETTAAKLEEIEPKKRRKYTKRARGPNFGLFRNDTFFSDPNTKIIEKQNIINLSERTKNIDLKKCAHDEGNNSATDPIFVRGRNIKCPHPEPNIINLISENKMCEKIYGDELYYFTEIINFTNTLEGYFENINFNEETLIKKINVKGNFKLFICNYGEVRDPNFEFKKGKANRRARKRRIQKRRKLQGSGTEFNSQITFVAVTDKMPDKRYLFKIFRTGKMQLPGIRQELFADVIEKANELADILTETFIEDVKTGANDENWSPLNPLFCVKDGEEFPKVKLNILIPLMKNYKFSIKIPEGNLLSLSALKLLLISIKEGMLVLTPNHEDVTYPQIFMVKYSRRDPKLAIKFNTPNERRPDKILRVNIFSYGKVNFLGGLNVFYTKGACYFLHHLIMENIDKIFVKMDLTPPDKNKEKN